MITSHVMPIFLASATAMFVTIFPQPKDFRQAISGKIQFEASAPLQQLSDDPDMPILNAAFRTDEGASALEALIESGCVNDLERATPARLRECGGYIVDAMEQIDRSRLKSADARSPSNFEQIMVRADEYLTLAAINVCRAHWVLGTTDSGPIDLPTCSTIPH